MTARLRPTLLLAVTVLAAAPATLAQPADGGGSYRVRYRTADAVYLDAGSAAGLAEGDRLEVWRGSERAGVVEVIFVAPNSASCRILEDSGPIRADDVARLLGEGAPAAEPPGEPAADVDEPTAPAAVDLVSPTPAPAPRARPANDLRGSLTVDWESFSDGGDRGLDFTRTSSRLNLRAARLGGRPWELRARTRTRRIERDRDLGDSTPDSESLDRFHELSLAWEPPEGRFALAFGRLRPGSGIGAGTLDGAVGEVRFGRGLHLGAFAGTESDLDQLAFDSDRQKVGLFLRWAPEWSAGPAPVDLFVAGVREDGVEDVSREFVAVQLRWAASSRWSLYQRAEIDLNRGWREEVAGSSSQLSNLAVSLVGRLSPAARLTVTYDRYERHREEETRFIPEDLFDAEPRQGLRLRLGLGRPGGLTGSVVAGYRERRGDEEPAITLGGGVAHHRLLGGGLSLAADVTGFSNRFTEGGLATLRASRRIRDVHFVDLTLGGRLSRTREETSPLGTEELVTHWLRLGGWAELPGAFFLRGEAEWTGGDELEGQRFSLGLGIRL